MFQIQSKLSNQPPMPFPQPWGLTWLIHLQGHGQTHIREMKGEFQIPVIDISGSVTWPKSSRGPASLA